MPRQYTTRRERKRLWCAFFLLLALAAFLLWQELSPWEKAPAPNPPAAGLTLRVIDVGQAQSLLLTCGEDAILVDAGEYAAGGQVLAALSRAGVKSLTAAILTHPHGDHYGGMRTVLEKTPAAAFYTAAVPESQLPTAQSYEKLLSTLSEQAIPAAYLFAGDTIPLGDATVTVLSPPHGGCRSRSGRNPIGGKDRTGCRCAGGGAPWQRHFQLGKIPQSRCPTLCHPLGRGG